MTGATVRDERVDVVVVGAGVAGLSAAWELSRRGRSVVLVERFGPGHDRGSSHGGERIVRLAYTAPEYVALCREALTGWADLEAEYGATLLHPTGTIDHGDRGELAALAATYQACDVAHEWLGPGEASARWPGLAFDGPVLFQPDGGWVEAAAALRALADGATARGAQLRFDTRVTALRPSDAGAEVVLASGEVLQARSAVIAAGPWAAPVLHGHVELPPITVTQEQVAYCRPRDPALVWPAFIFRGTSSLYGLPTPDGLVKVGGHGEGPVIDPDHPTTEPDPRRSDRLRAEIERWLPGVDPVPVRTVACLYATTPTDDFVLDRVGPLVLAAGLGGHGFKFGPALGRVLADLVDGTGDPGPFALGRGASTSPGTSGYR